MYTLKLVKFDQNQCPKELFSKMTPPKFMTTCDFSKNDTLKFIFCSKKGTPKNGTSRTCIYGSYPPPPDAKSYMILAVETS